MILEPGAVELPLTRHNLEPLLNAGLDPNYVVWTPRPVADEPRSLLARTIHQGDRAAVLLLLLHRGANPNARFGEALQEAARRSNRLVVDLLRHGADWRRLLTDQREYFLRPGPWLLAVPPAIRQQLSQLPGRRWLAALQPEAAVAAALGRDLSRYVLEVL